MRRWMVVWAAVTVALTLVGVANAHEGDLDRAGLKDEARQNRALARYLRLNGMPDAAEVHHIFDQPPWEDHQVTLYYLGQHKQISFARARILGSPEVQIRRSERTLTDADVRALQGRTGRLGGAEPSGCAGSATERAECAAARAESAADRVDTAATRAETAADKTEAIVEKMAARPAPAPKRRVQAKRSKSAQPQAKRSKPAQPQEPAAGLNGDKASNG